MASEDLLYMLSGLGVGTGVDMDKLIAASNFICDFLERPSGSKAARAIMAKRHARSKVNPRARPEREWRAKLALT